ncbi:hypothetical protein [Nitrosomonas sp.]|uniref:hypothetical protein n=1 Tax=Nitrosomonas sp. TaxID=42353 RepID=UPI0032EC710E
MEKHYIGLTVLSLLIAFGIYVIKTKSLKNGEYLFFGTMILFSAMALFDIIDTTYFDRAGQIFLESLVEHDVSCGGRSCQSESDIRIHRYE